MDPLNQNPNTSPQPEPAPKFSPQIQPAVLNLKHHTHWTLVAVVVFLLAAFFMVWLYAGKLDLKTTSITNMPNPSMQETEAVQDQQLRAEAENLDLGDPDAEFQSIDQELNSL